MITLDRLTFFTLDVQYKIQYVMYFFYETRNKNKFQCSVQSLNIYVHGILIKEHWMNNCHIYCFSVHFMRLRASVERWASGDTAAQGIQTMHA